MTLAPRPEPERCDLRYRRGLGSEHPSCSGPRRDPFPPCSVTVAPCIVPVLNKTAVEICTPNVDQPCSRRSSWNFGSPERMGRRKAIVAGAGSLTAEPEVRLNMQLMQSLSRQITLTDTRAVSRSCVAAACPVYL